MKSKQIIMATTYGFCSGVERAISLAEKMLREYQPPLYAYNELVHNHQVVKGLRERGFLFVRSLHEVPHGARVLFSAHGVSPAVWQEAAELGLQIVDATCPLVARVHGDVRRHAAAGYAVTLVGYRGHDEVVGVVGEAPELVTVIESVAEAELYQPPAGTKGVAAATQTTLSFSETGRILEVLRRRFPELITTSTTDICRATTERQEAVVALAGKVEALLVLGSCHSSNARRLVEVARERGCEAWLVADLGELPCARLAGLHTLGITAGASTPRSFIDEVITALTELGWQPPI